MRTIEKLEMQDVKTLTTYRIGKNINDQDHFDLENLCNNCLEFNPLALDPTAKENFFHTSMKQKQ
jgi:hypothetical protein